MPDHATVEAVLAGVEVLIVAALSVPSITHLVTKTTIFNIRYETVASFYEDDDGEATEKSTQEYTDLPSRVAAWISSTLGLAASIVAGTLSQRAQYHAGSGSGLLHFLNLWADVIIWVSLV